MKRFLVNILYDFTFWYLWLYMETFSVLHNCMNSDAVRFLMWTLQLWRCLTDWWTTTDNLNQDLSSFLRELWYHWCMQFDFRGFSKSYKKRYEFFHTYNIYVNMKWILWGKILKTGLAISYYCKSWSDLDGPVCVISMFYTWEARRITVFWLLWI